MVRLEISKLYITLFILLTLQACSETSATQAGKKTMIDYEVYAEDKELSSLFVKTGVFDNGSDKTLHIGIYHDTQGVKVWRGLLERQLFFKETKKDQLNIRFNNDLNLLEVYDTKDTDQVISYFNQEPSQLLNFDNFIGVCADTTDFRGGIDCFISLKINDLKIQLTYDKSQLTQFKDFKNIAEEVIADYLPKHADKF